MQIQPTAVREIAALVSGEVAGDPDLHISGFNEIHRVMHGDCAFVDHHKYYERALHSAASAIIINERVSCPPGKALIIHPEPFSAFNTLTRHFSPRRNAGAASQSISSTARTGTGTIVMHGCVLGENVVIGKNCVLHPNVVIYDNCTLGNNVTVHANTTIGSDAFYLKKRETGYEPLYSCGTVEIADHVIIGANCTIDRGVTDVTRIGRGTVLDNQVHVGHDVLIGENCLFAAQVGIAGACTIGNRVTVWGQAGISSGIVIGDGATILAQSGLGENVPVGATFFGTPAGPSREKMKEVFALKQLPDLIKKLY